MSEHEDEIVGWGSNIRRIQGDELKKFRGGGLGSPGEWKCPACGGTQAGPIEAGCVQCGAGTEAQREKVAAEKAAQVLEQSALAALLVDEAVELDAQGDIALQRGWTEGARLTIARALAHYAEFGQPGPGELSKPQVLQWARLIAGIGD